MTISEPRQTSVAAHVMEHGTIPVPELDRLRAEIDRLSQLRDDAHEVVLDALAWLDPESAKRLMASPSYRRFKDALKK